MTDRTSELRDAAARLERAREDLRRAIIRAHAEGMSLRQIAAVVGISHETVRRLARDATDV